MIVKELRDRLNEISSASDNLNVVVYASTKMIELVEIMHYERGRLVIEGRTEE